MNMPPTFRWNLLDRKGAKALLRWPGFPTLLQASTLFLMAALAVNGWGVGRGLPAHDLMTLRKTSLTTLAVWGLWWPAMILLALLAGRIWCTVCPMELLGRVGHGVGRWIGLRGRPLGGLRAGWGILAGYALLQMVVAGWSIHRIPHATALLLVALGATALLSGLAFREERAFCKALCPAAALLSVYGRATRVQLDRVDASVFEQCETLDCVSPKRKDLFDARSCPSSLRPFDRAPSDGCVLCFQCAKACPKGNLGFGSTTEAAPSRRPQLLKPFEAGFVMIAAGFVTHELAGEVKWLDGLFHWPPTHLAGTVPGLGFGWAEALWFLVLFPGLFWSLVVLAARLAGHREGTGTLLRAAATGAVPVVALAHAAKALAKIGSWGGYLPMAIKDPRGMDALQAFSTRRLPTPAGWWSLPALGCLLLAGLAFLTWRSLRWAGRHPEGWRPAFLTGVAGAGLLFTVVLAVWART